jgi:hypothetical protein
MDCVRKTSMDERANDEDKGFAMDASLDSEEQMWVPL